MKPLENNPRTPRETVLRMLAHLREDASYAEIIRQVRILQDIEETLEDIEPEITRELVHDSDSMLIEGRQAPPSATVDVPSRATNTRARRGSTPHRRRLSDLLLREAAWID